MTNTNATRFNQCDGNAGHLLSTRCVACTARALSLVNLATVELWAEHGMIDGAARDGYRHVWAISADRSAAYYHWTALPDTEDAREFARVLGTMVPSGRAYC